MKHNSAGVFKTTIIKGGIYLRPLTMVKICGASQHSVNFATETRLIQSQQSLCVALTTYAKVILLDKNVEGIEQTRVVSSPCSG